MDESQNRATADGRALGVVALAAVAVGAVIAGGGRR
jgi:hypothetical protein